MKSELRLYCVLLLIAVTGACTRVPPSAGPVRAPAVVSKPAAGLGEKTITRGEVLKIAKSYAEAKWACSTKNADDQYNLMRAGQTYQGVAYNRGGWDTI